MELKRFQAQTVHDALRAVREHLGPDALVVSTRTALAPGPRGWFGRRVVEVTAADARTGVPENRHAVRVSRALSRRWDRRWVAPLVARDGAYAPVEVFVGPRGAGKTATIAKIAAQERARSGHRLGLVATGGDRGAVDPLRVCADVIGAPLSVAHTPYELQSVVETATVPLLVDSGPWTGEGDARDDLFRVLASRPGVRTHLVVAAETPPETLRRVCDRLAGIRPCRAVITKVDEAESLLGLLAALRDRRLLVSYLGTGPRVPEDLRIASPAVLASWVRGGHRAGADA